MQINIDNGQLIIEINGKSFFFEAHAEDPRPSMLGWGLSAGGKHWSNRDKNIPLEKHTSIQDVAVSERYVAWYVQEFIPNGIDYKISPKAAIYVGNLETGEERLVYKGECYGDLCFDDNDLYFNMGNKVAVMNLENENITILFKHSGIKKNKIRLCITPKRIFFNHWTKDNKYLMWYDRETGETVNPHIDSGCYYLLDDETVIYQSLYCAWCISLTTMKKKRFFAKKRVDEICKFVCDFCEIPVEYYQNEDFRIELKELKEDKLYFCCKGKFMMEGLDYEESNEKAWEMNVPKYLEVMICCDFDGKNIKFTADKNDIVKQEPEDGDKIRRWYMGM